MKNIFPIIDDHGNQINDEIGARVSAIISSTRDKAEKSKILFTEFIQANEYVAWHIENGWFIPGGDSRMYEPSLNFTWYMDFRGAFGGNIPKVGETMVVIDTFQP